jgi:hypothetical protein
MSGDQILTLQQAARLIGWRGRWAWRKLLRLLRSLERRTGRKILIEGDGEGTRRRYQVSRGALLHHLPSSWLTDARIRDRLADEMERYRDRVAQLELKVEELSAQVGRLLRFLHAPLPPSSVAGAGNFRSGKERKVIPAVPDR